MRNALVNRLEVVQGSLPTKPVLAAADITVTWRDTAVLRDVSFVLGQRHVLGLIGESGAGKSMIGRVIARQLPPGFDVSNGHLMMADRDLLTLSEREHRSLLGRRIAFIPQEPMSALNPSLTIEAHFNEHLRRLNVPGRDILPSALQMLADMRLDAPRDVLAKYPFQLSGGMCQRVLIALAFASNPDIVIADEPTASLDVTTQVHIVHLLRRLQERHGTSVLFITHQLGLAGHICDDVAVLYAGEVVEQGPARDVFGRPRHPYTVGLNGANPRFGGERSALLSMVGQMPTINDFRRLEGCRFAPRCAAAIDPCRNAGPPLRMFDGRKVRCPVDDARPLSESQAAPAKVSAPRGRPILEIKDLAKTFRRGGIFGGRSVTHAVKPMSITVGAGEFLGVVGESGSGKSTLGRMIMGLETPSEGQILLDGLPVLAGAAEWKRRIDSVQFVFQDPRSALNPRRRVLSLVTQPMEAPSVASGGRLQRATELMSDIGLSLDMLDRFPLQMSGGQRQRINIARALCARPRLLVADEIVSGLDVSVQAQILNLLTALRSEHDIALIFISHDLAVVRHLCERVIVMRRGEIVEAGATEKVFARPLHPYTRELLAAVPSEDLSKPWPVWPGEAC